MNNIKYPKEVFSALTKDKVLSITAHFIPVQQDSGVSPYKIYQPKTSRFVVSIVNRKYKICSSSRYICSYPCIPSDFFCAQAG